MASMRRAALADTTRFVLTSPELIGALLLTFLRYLWPFPYATIGNGVIQGTEFGKNATLTFPVVLLVANVGLSWKVLYPSTKNRVLVAWPDYPRLRRRVVFSLLVTIFALLCCIISSAFADAFATPNGAPRLGQLVTASLGASAISVLTMLFASLTIKEITEHLKDEG